MSQKSSGQEKYDIMQDKLWCQNINSTSQNEKFQIYISMIQQRDAEGGSHMAKQHDKQFKLDAVQYYQDHKDLC